MSISVIQNLGSPTFAVNPSLAFPSANGAGRTLVITFWINTSVTPTVTDTQGNTWLAAGSKQISNGSASWSWAFTCLGCAAGANTVTVNTGSGFQGAITGLFEVDISGPTVENYSTNLSASNSPTTPTITPSAANSIVFAHTQCGGNSSCSISSPFTGVSTSVFGKAGYEILTSTAAVSASFTGAGTSNGQIIFDITAGGGGGGGSAKPVVCIMQ